LLPGETNQANNGLIKSSELIAVVKVFIVDELSVVRRGLASVLESYAGYKVVGEASNVKEALPRIEALKPELIIIDIYRPGGGGVNAISLLHKKVPAAKVLVLTDAIERESFSSSIKAGAKGYLLKASEMNEIIDSIRLVATGDAVVYSAKAIKLYGASGDRLSIDGTLSDREKQVLRLVAKGQTNREIAAQCYISETTVKAHLRRISEKLNVKNRTQAVATAIDRGMLEKE
jgi:DNA-binding NarL/FixJ family response regulator